MGTPYINNQANKVGDLTATELNTLDGATSNIQTQLDAKQAAILVSGILKGDGSGTISKATANTDYLSVTNPVASGSGTFSGDVYASATQTSTVTGTVVVTSCINGDVDADGEIDTGDVSLTSQYLDGTISLTTIQKACADINADGAITSEDVTLMMNYIAGWAWEPEYTYVTYATLSGVPKAAVINSVTGIPSDSHVYMLEDGIMVIHSKTSIANNTTISASVTTGKKLATEEYVGLNGGKIDSIKVNGTVQPITNKVVDLAVVEKNTAITGDTKCKITYDSDGLVTAGADLEASDIPSLDANKITSGTFADARIASASTWNGKLDKTGGIISTNAVAMDSSGLPTFNGTRVAASTLAVGKNGIAIGGVDTANDGGIIFMESSASESNKLIIGLGDDSTQGGASDYIAFRYYDTSGNVTYESKIPSASGTLALTGDITTKLNRSSNVNAADTNYATVMARGIQASTTDLTAGSSALTSGTIYLVYE